MGTRLEGPGMSAKVGETTKDRVWVQLLYTHPIQRIISTTLTLGRSRRGNHPGQAQGPRGLLEVTVLKVNSAGPLGVCF